jgi:integrase/recombinase XerD
MNLYPYRRKVAFSNINKALRMTSKTKNQNLIIEYIRYLELKESQDVKVHTAGKRAIMLARICVSLGKPLDEVNSRDIDNLLLEIKYYKNNSNPNRPLSPATIADYRRTLKEFYNFYIDHDKRIDNEDFQIRIEARKLYSKIKKINSCAQVKNIDPSLIITEKDLQIILDKGCNTLKQKALISVLHETGCRIGELLSMRVKHVKFDHNSYAHVHFPESKTFARTLLIVNSVHYLNQYLDYHPDKDNLDAPLWYKEDTISKKKFSDTGNLPYLRHSGAKKIIKKCVELSGIKKKSNPHHFRHSRATIDCQRLKPAILCKRMGWSLNSKQIKTYIHLSNDDIDKAILEVNGVKVDGENKNTKTECSCGTYFSIYANRCPKCGRPKDYSTYLEDDEIIRKEIDETFKKQRQIMANPKLWQKFENFLENEKIQN